MCSHQRVLQFLSLISIHRNVGWFDLSGKHFFVHDSSNSIESPTRPLIASDISDALNQPNTRLIDSHCSHIAEWHIARFRNSERWLPVINFSCETVFLARATIVESCQEVDAEQAKSLPNCRRRREPMGGGWVYYLESPSSQWSISQPSCVIVLYLTGVLCMWETNKKANIFPTRRMMLKDAK